MSSQSRKKSTFWAGTVLALSLLPGLARELPNEMIDGLGSQDYPVREAAQTSLLAWARLQPDGVKEELFRQSHSNRDPEVRQRCQSVLRELVMDEYLKEGEGYIGIQMQDELAKLPGDPEECNAIRVVQVMDDSAAHKAGLQIGDLIAGLENEFWRDGPAAIPFGDQIRAKNPKTKILLQVIRGGKLIDVEVVLERRPMMLNQFFLNQTNFDPDAAENAAREAYFRRWLSQRKVPD